MKRRTYLASVAAFTAAVPGCLGGGNSTDQNDPDDNDSAQPGPEQAATNDSDPSNDDNGEPVEPDSNDTDEEDDTNATEDANGTDETEDGPDASGEPDSSDPGSEEAATAEDFEITTHDIVSDSYDDAVVTGEIEYTGNVVASYVEVVATFYDEAGNELPGRAGVGNHYNSASDVSPGTTLTFEIVTWIDYDDVAEYELDIWVG